MQKDSRTYKKGYKSYSYLFSQASFVFLVKKNPLERKVFMSIQSKGFKYIDITER